MNKEPNLNVLLDYIEHSHKITSFKKWYELVQSIDDKLKKGGVKLTLDERKVIVDCLIEIISRKILSLPADDLVREAKKYFVSIDIEPEMKILNHDCNHNLNITKG